MPWQGSAWCTGGVFNVKPLNSIVACKLELRLRIFCLLFGEKLHMGSSHKVREI